MTSIEDITKNSKFISVFNDTFYFIFFYFSKLKQNKKFNIKFLFEFQNKNIIIKKDDFYFKVFFLIFFLLNLRKLDGIKLNKN